MPELPEYMNIRAGFDQQWERILNRLLDEHIARGSIPSSERGSFLAYVENHKEDIFREVLGEIEETGHGLTEIMETSMMLDLFFAEGARERGELYSRGEYELPKR